MLWIISWRHDCAGKGWPLFIGPNNLLFLSHAKSQLSASGLPGRSFRRAFCLEANLNVKRRFALTRSRKTKPFLGRPSAIVGRFLNGERSPKSVPSHFT